MINPEFTKELAQLVNRYSLENCSNTPDWIVAEYLTACLEAYNKAKNGYFNFEYVSVNEAMD